MTNKYSSLLNLILFASFIVSCEAVMNRENKVNRGEPDSFIVVEQDNDSEIVVSKNWFNKFATTIRSETVYNKHGNITKWKWFDAKSKYALVIFYYDSLGNYIRYHGSPFVSSNSYKQDGLAVQVVKPPNIKSIVGYRDFIGDKLVMQRAIEPSLTDSTAWAVIKHHEFIKHNKYFLYYYIVNSANQIIDSAVQEVVR